ncbi:PDDEXK-like protein of unknown function [Pseudovibrio ascidiaceicola]|uniref:Putative exodeoxyribonuclease 8 PDDEXK-like domain-containing protein n=2 Tax=Pseudovibrio ascidiaceicola TaxID=285279 RepID=A0A1I4E281_9HYPH|nr:PDDEXK-like protein of unknown function [Pseudovibrio ascidiaceicola]
MLLLSFSLTLTAGSLQSRDNIMAEKIWDTYTITEPGIYAELPIEKYHSHVCVGPSISSSGLRAIANGSPAEYWATSYLNPEAEPREDKDHFRLGQAAHTLFLGEGKFDEQFSVKPATYVDPKTGAEKKWNGNANVCKEWIAEQEQSGKRLLSTEQMHDLKGMAGMLPWQANCPNSGLRNSGMVQSGILDGAIERSLIWKDPETHIWLKARPDLVDLNDAYPVDLKTTREARKVENSIADLGYNMQAALVAEGLREVCDLDCRGFAFVFVQTSAPYTVEVVELSEEDLELARRELRRSIRLFADCLNKNEWPAGTGEPRTWITPQWYSSKLENLEAANDLPILENVA